MSKITNWTELINKVTEKKCGVFPKLLIKINQTIRPYQKANELFDLHTVQKNHQEIFNNYKLLYDQLLIETDATDILVGIPSLISNINIIFNITSVGKWIKIHSGNSNRIFFFDEEKTMISDKAIADFLNKIETVREKYKYFGMDPIVYCKFRTLPSIDVVEYLKSFNVIAIEFNQPTSLINYPKFNNNKVLLDQSMVLTLCSNLSYGLSESFYRSADDKSKEIMVKNKSDLDEFLSNKTIIINQYVYEQTKFKINQMAGSNEKQRFEELCKKVTIVPDIQNPRFNYLKDIELTCVSVAEREETIMVTGNQRLCHKIDTYYQEIKYKLFIGAQLAEAKFK